MAGDPGHQSTWGIREFLGYWDSQVDAASFRKRKLQEGAAAGCLRGPSIQSPEPPPSAASSSSSAKARRVAGGEATASAAASAAVDDMSDVHKLSRDELVQRVHSLAVQLQNARTLIAQLQQRNMELQEGLGDRLARTVEDSVRRSLSDLGRCPSTRSYYGAAEVSMVSPSPQAADGAASGGGGGHHGGGHPHGGGGSSGEFFPGSGAFGGGGGSGGGGGGAGPSSSSSSAQFPVPAAVCSAQLAQSDDGSLPSLGDYLTDDEIRFVNEATTYTRLVCHLMAALFSRDEMATSSVTGKTTKGVTSQQLDPLRTGIVIRHTQQRFPHTSVLQIRAKMAQKCKDCRTTMRKKHRSSAAAAAAAAAAAGGGPNGGGGMGGPHGLMAVTKVEAGHIPSPHGHQPHHNPHAGGHPPPPQAPPPPPPPPRSIDQPVFPDSRPPSDLDSV